MRIFMPSCKIHLGKNSTPVFRSTEMDLIRNGRRNQLNFYAIRKRKVFYGKQSFARGACAAGAERLITHRLRDYRYMSRSLVLTSVGMEMRVMGAPTYYPLIEAGRNWYESSADIELILDDTDELVFVVEHMSESERRHVVMKLPGLPQRPN